MKEIFLTKEQHAKIKDEYEFYIHEKRPEVVERIKEAKSFGDLSENSEYDSAREEQAFVEAKIKDLEILITNAKLMDDNVATDVVSLGNIVKYQDVDSKEKSEYKIVGVGSNPIEESGPSISAATPIAKSLLGKKKNDVVKVEIPNGNKTLKILGIK